METALALITWIPLLPMIYKCKKNMSLLSCEYVGSMSRKKNHLLLPLTVISITTKAPLAHELATKNSLTCCGHR